MLLTKTEVQSSKASTAAIIAEATLITLALGLVFGATLVDLARDWWNDPNLSYGLLVPPLALYFAWLRCRDVLSIPATPTAGGLFALAISCLVFLFGRVGAEFFLMRVSFVLVLASLTWTFWGRHRLQALAFPFVLLAAMVPLPAILYLQMASPLQLLASNVATNALQSIGVAAYRDGNIIQLAKISLGVDEACSGLHSLLPLIIGGLLIGQLQYDRIRTKILLVFLSVPLAVLFNVLRVTGTGILADYHEEFAMGFYHSFSGWLVFVLGIGSLLAVSKLLRHTE